MKLTLEANELLKNHHFPQWKHGDKILQLGSCFSTNMTHWFRKAGFEVYENPFGVVFHPIALADQILLALAARKPKSIVQKDGVFVSFDASGILYGTSEAEIVSLIRQRSIELKQALLESKVLIVTFGSSHGYEFKETSEVVSNCHQQPSNVFEKKLFSCESMIEKWQHALDLVRELNPEMKVVFTVSPVRYIRDGLIENNQSKAALIALVHRLVQQENRYYLPSYELVVDILRDYRFYTSDLVHPNDLAVESVWEMCYENCFDSATKSIVSELFKIRQLYNHKVLYPNTEQGKRFQALAHKKRESFLSQFPVVVW